jgi:hypothetical protein
MKAVDVLCTCDSDVDACKPGIQSHAFTVCSLDSWGTNNRQRDIYHSLSLGGHTRICHTKLLVQLKGKGYETLELFFIFVVVSNITEPQMDRRGISTPRAFSSNSILSNALNL